mmetsp:Transcript_112948/g.319411  ORF Transcript_112948/g.319411 Transcript_112948/m.319411 type:complete len:230 (-) Transcript_112948:74-763(-)
MKLFVVRVVIARFTRDHLDGRLHPLPRVVAHAPDDCLRDFYGALQNLAQGTEVWPLHERPCFAVDKESPGRALKLAQEVVGRFGILEGLRWPRGIANDELGSLNNSDARPNCTRCFVQVAVLVPTRGNLMSPHLGEVVPVRGARQVLERRDNPELVANDHKRGTPIVMRYAVSINKHGVANSSCAWGVGLVVIIVWQSANEGAQILKTIVNTCGVEHPLAPTVAQKAVQ